MSGDNSMTAYIDKKKENYDISKKGKDIESKGRKIVKNLIDDSKNYENLNHSWIKPNQISSKSGLAVRDIVPGPFISPRLTKITPYLVNKKNKSGKVNKIRQGIPDNWRFGSEIDKNNNNLRVTDFVWNKIGLPLTQGIPDPWKLIISNDDSLDDEIADICLCNPIIQKEPKLIKRENKEKIRSKTITTDQNIKSENMREKREKKIEEKINCSCNKNNSKVELQKRNSQYSQTSNDIIQCDISGKITLKGKSFDGIGSLKFNCGQNGNEIGKKKEDNHHFLSNMSGNNIQKKSKIRNMVCNFEATKTFSKLKKTFSTKKKETEENFGDETKLVCYKCSCPYFKVLPEENSSFQETINNLHKSTSNLKIQSEDIIIQKTNEINCKKGDCKKKRRKNDNLEKKIKDKSIENFNHVKVSVDKKKDESLDDKIECGCELKYSEDSTDSGNHADISELSKNEDLSSRKSQSITSLIQKPLIEKLTKNFSSQFKSEKKKKKVRKRNLCSPCDRRPTRKQNNSIDDKIELLQNQEDKKYSESKKSISKKIETFQDSDYRQRSVSYASDVEILPEEKEKFKKNLRRKSTQFPNKKMIPILEKKHDLDQKDVKNVENDDLVIEICNNSNEELLITEDNKKLSYRSEENYRERGGGIEILSSDLEQKREIRKIAWSTEENKGNFFRNLNDQSDSDDEISNKLSSLLEESLDLISEPIGRKKNSEIFKIPDEKNENKNECYVKYCYDRRNNLGSFKNLRSNFKTL